MVIFKKILTVLPLFILCSFNPPYKVSPIDSFFSSTTQTTVVKEKTILWVKKNKESPRLLQDLLQEKYSVITTANRLEFLKAYKTLKPKIVVLPLNLKQSFEKTLKENAITAIFYPTPSKEKFLNLPVSKKTLRKKQKLLEVADLPLYESFLIKKAKKTKSGKISFTKEPKCKNRFVSRFTDQDILVFVSNNPQDLLLGAGGFLERLKKLNIPITILNSNPLDIDAFFLNTPITAENIYVFLPHEETQAFLTKTQKKIQNHLEATFKKSPNKSFYMCQYKVPLLSTWTPYLDTPERYFITSLRGDNSNSSTCSKSCGTCSNHSKSCFFITNTTGCFNTQLTAYNFTH